MQELVILKNKEAVTTSLYFRSAINSSKCLNIVLYIKSC